MKFIFACIAALFFSACSTLELTGKDTLPAVEKTKSVTLFSLNNYTDTPRAGMRASNLIEGALLTRGYAVVNAISTGAKTLQEQIKTASENNSDYLLTGGVSEWRYKTGIDGEPAISLHVKMIEVATQKIVWNATASSNDWGNASIGTTAQQMIESMFQIP
jgi:polysaccharide biosynthesis protein PelC